MANNIVAAETKNTEPTQQLPERESIIVPIMLLKAALSVAAKNDVRNYLNGVMIQSEGRDLRVVGTDGHRLFVAGDREQRDYPAWLAEGFVLNRECLSETLGLLGKLGGGNIAIDWAPGHKKANLRTLDGAASVGIPVVDGKFPEWRRVVESGSSALGNHDRTPLDTATVSAKYLKEAGAVAAVMNAANISPFVGKSDAAMMFAFDTEYPALLYIMPVRAEQKMNEGTLRMIGAGIKGSIAAFRAHRTRLVSNLNLVKSDKQKQELTEKIEGVEKRIMELTGIMNQRPALSA